MAPRAQSVSLTGIILLLGPAMGTTCIPPTVVVDGCASDADCDDDDHCTADVCIEGSLCQNTLSSAFCDDALFCNGLEECAAGQCLPGLSPCSDIEVCDEEADECMPDPCRSQCEPYASCEEQPLDSFDDFATTRDEWLGNTANCEPDISTRIAGSCGGNRTFLASSDGYVLEARFFDQTSGAFLSMGIQSDIIDGTCCGASYWPTQPDCSDGLITEVAWRPEWEDYQPGDPIDLTAYFHRYCGP